MKFTPSLNLEVKYNFSKGFINKYQLEYVNRYNEKVTL